MTAANPISAMEEEHRFILEVARAMDVLAAHLDAGGEIAPALVLDIVDFMRRYADEGHHGKEEARLFPLLVEKGVPATGCPIAALRQEHVMGRALVSDLAQAANAYGDAPPAARDKARGALAQCLRGLAALYPGHIWKEDYLLFPMSAKVLAPGDLERLAAECHTVDAAFGGAARDRYEQFAAALPRWIEAVPGFQPAGSGALGA